MKKILFTIVLFACMSAVSSAQQVLQSEYFLDNNPFAYRLNPALAAEKSHVSIALSNVNSNVSTNFGINSFLFARDGKLVTGLNKSVSASEFLGGLNKSNALAFGLNENLFSIGIVDKDGTGFTNVEMNLVVNGSASYPKGLFEMLKKGSSPDPFDLSNLNVREKAYLELAGGYTRKINSKITVGGRLKFLLGAECAEANFDKSSITVNSGQIGYNVNASLRAAAAFIQFGTKISEINPAQIVFDMGSGAFNPQISPAGYGGAIDLGVVYKPLDFLTCSFSVQDLGGIAWKYNILGRSQASDTFTGVLYDFNNPSSVEDELNGALENLKNIIEFQPVEGSQTAFEWLSCSINAGVRCRAPFYNRLSLGVRGTYRVDKYNPWWDLRAGLTITPIDWFSLSGNVGYGTFKGLCGAALSINVANINFILGFDGYMGPLASLKMNEGGVLQNVTTPLKAFRYNGKLGFAVTFGKRHNDFVKKVKKAK